MTCRRSRSPRRGGSSTRRSGSRVFARLDEQPLACASIAQIHGGLLRTGREVVVKVRRPGIEEEVALDLELLRSLTSFAEVRSETARLLQLAALAEELEAHLTAELDFVEEAHGSELIARIVGDAEHLVVPAVIHPYVTDSVLVQERIVGERVVADHGLDPERAAVLARELFGAYVQQITVHGVYHADPHRGNILLTEDGRLALLDFGLLGRLDDDTRRALGLLLLALAQNRADDVADLILGLSLTTLASDEAGLRPRSAPQAAALSLAAPCRDPAPARRSPTCSALRSGTGSRFRPASRSSARRSPRRIRSPARSTRRSTRSSCSRRTASTVMLRETERIAGAATICSLSRTLRREPLLRMPRRIGQLASRLETGTLKVGITADRSPRARARRPLGREPHRRGDDHPRCS